jgi:hypothetical protein
MQYRLFLISGYRYTQMKKVPYLTTLLSWFDGESSCDVANLLELDIVYIPVS